MKRLSPALLIIGLFAMSRTPLGYGIDTVRIEADIYQIQADISGETSMTDYVWVNKTDEQQARNDRLTLFTQADLTLGKYHLKATETQWAWALISAPQNRPATDTAPSEHALAAPRVECAVGQEFAIGIQSGETEYFEARAEGGYDLKKLDEPVGLSAKATVQPGESSRIRLQDLQFIFRSIEGREALEGSSSNSYGKPIVKEQNVKTSLQLRPGQYYGLMLSTPSQGFLMIRLRVNYTEPQTPGIDQRPRLHAAAQNAETVNQYYVEFDVVRILGDVSGEAVNGETKYDVRETPMILFSQAHLRIDGQDLVLGEESWHPMIDQLVTSERAEVICSPRVLVQDKGYFGITIGQEVINAYEARKAGMGDSYEWEGQKGVLLNGNVEGLENDRIALQNLTFIYRGLGTEGSFQGAKSRDDSKPDDQARTLVTSTVVQDKREHGILLPSKDGGAILIRIMAKKVGVEKME